jgi:hypothetical protein
MGDAQRIDVAAVRFVHDAADAVEIDERVQPFRLGPCHLVKVHAVAAGLGGLDAQLVLACLGLGKVERTGLEDAAALTRLGLAFAVEVHRVVLDAADVGDVVQAVDLGRGMPRRSDGQFGPFEKDRPGPPLRGEVIEDRAADKAAADHHRIRMGSQRPGLPVGVTVHGSPPPISSLRRAT